MKHTISKEHQDMAIETVRNILHLFHEKRYDEVPAAVDESEVEDLPRFLREYIQGTLDLNEMDSFDEYGAPATSIPNTSTISCTFSPTPTAAASRWITR